MSKATGPIIASSSYSGLCFLPLGLLILSQTAVVVVRGAWQVHQLDPHATDNVTRLTLSLADAIGSSKCLESFTLCVWFKVTSFRDLSCLLSYALSAEEDDVITVFVRPGGVEFNYYEIKVRHHMPIRPLWWYPTCVAVHLDVVSMMVAGEEQRLSKKSQPLALNGSLVIGQEQDEIDGGFIYNQAFVGHVTGFTFWDYGLRYDQLQAWSNCEHFNGPEACLYWNRTAWKIHNDTGTVMSHYDGPCCKNETDQSLILFTNKMSWKAAHKFLQRAGLSMATSNNTQERRKITTLIKKYEKECTNAYSEGVSVWLGIFVNETTDVFGNEAGINMKREKSIREYAISQDDKGFFHREHASEKLCFIGQYTKMPQEVHLQGLSGSESSRLSFIISPTSPNDQQNSMYLHGYGDYRIVRDYYHSRWCLSNKAEGYSADSNKMTCTMTRDPPFGRHLWNVGEESCKKTSIKSVTLTLSTCAYDHFTCPDSSCTHLSKLCDNVLECQDGADESNCFTCIKLPGYVEAIPPRVPVQLLVKVTITRIRSLDLLASALNLDATLNVAWTDHRLEFRHLHNNSEGALNAVILEEHNSKVWMPTFKVVGGTLTQREVEKDSLQVQKNTDGIIVDGAYIAYSGEENPLLLKLDLNIVSHCHFDLAKYPWDVQECVVKLRVRQLFSFQVEVTEESEVVSCPGGLVEYKVKACQLRRVSGGFAIMLVMERRSEFHIWSTYLPTTLLLGIGYGTLFLPVERFPERGGMGLTTLLVFISLYTDVSSSLPNTANLKLIDVWFVYNILFLSFIIATHLLACGSTEEPEERKWVAPAKKRCVSRSNTREHFILKIARFAFGIVTIIFLICYFVSANY